jgi:DNA-binding NarL/FixJ family response regulator
MAMQYARQALVCATQPRRPLALLAAHRLLSELHTADTLAARLVATTPSRRAYPDGLTPREAEVLRFVARGRSNQEIAADLSMSVRTAERHISNIYGKIHARTRAEATAWAFHHDLT